MRAVAPTRVLPDYAGSCVSNVVPALTLHHDIGRGWVPDDVLRARQVVLLVLDGLGWEQLSARLELAPTLAAMRGAAITTVAPSTTATALTSLTTGTTPGEHGVVGYRIRTGGEILNTLRWTTAAGDARERLDPSAFQPLRPFAGQQPVVISRAEFAGSGFTIAHLRETQLVGYWSTSSIALEVRTALDRGDRLVYAYYDGIDKVAHASGLGQHYDHELAFADRLVAEVLAALPPGAALVVTADHGQVEVGERHRPLHEDVMALATAISGEARFVWLHAVGARAGELAATAEAHHGATAWVCPVEQVLDEGWFGRAMTSAARARLGDVAIVARSEVSFHRPGDPGPLLAGRHGSLTAAEMLVPLLSAVA
jgi:hypothetical protein